MGKRMSDDFSGGHDKKKKSTSTKNSSITLCLVNSPSWRRKVITSSVHNESAKVWKLPRLFQTDRVSDWSRFSDKHWQLPLWLLLFSSSFPKSACPTQALRHLWCFSVLQSFFPTENLGSHLAMSSDDRFLPQGKQSFPKICQVRPMLLTYFSRAVHLRNTPRTFLATPTLDVDI